MINQQYTSKSGIFFKLNDSFITKYKKKKPPFGFGLLGELTFYRTYSRIKEDGKNEQWWETVERVVNGTYSLQKRHIISHSLKWNEKKAQNSAQEMYDRIFNMKFLPPGRGLWAMGSPIIEERGIGAALNNCFAYETKILTKKGVRKIGDLAGTEQELLTRNGEWIKSPIRSFGKQDLVKLILKRDNLRKEIYTTENHRWFVIDEDRIITEKITSELKKGDRLQGRSVHQAKNNTEWTVSLVLPTDRTEEVYCATVPQFGCFTLEGNILTGNCAFVSTENLADHPTKPFEFLMDMSMLGCGVGCDTAGAGSFIIKGPTDSEPVEYVIPDTREGWVESLKLLLESYFLGTSPISFNYSNIRKAGLSIKGFGGISSGPDPLIELHNNIKLKLDAFIDKEISVTNIVDIQNLIGKTVVAGNVRRTAEILLGSPYSSEYLDLKNYNINPDRANYGWTSNNSVLASLGMDYSECAKRTMLNGEPGYIWLDNLQKYSRMCDPIDNKDWRVKGVNPCITSDTWITTDLGLFQVKDLINKNINVIVNGRSYKSLSKGFFHTGKKQTYVLKCKYGPSVKLTEDHKVMTVNRGWVQAKDLTQQDTILIHNHNNYYINNLNQDEIDKGYLLGLYFSNGSASRTGPKLSFWLNKDPQSINCYHKAIDIIDKNNNLTKWNKNNRQSNIAIQEIHRDIGNKYLTDICKEYNVWPNKNIDNKLLYSNTSLQIGFIKGFFDGDGHIEGSKTKGIRCIISQSNYDTLEKIQLLLNKFGIKSKIYNLQESGNRLLPDGKGGQQEYLCQNTYRLSISGCDAQKFINIIQPLHGKKIDAWNKLNQNITFYQSKFEFQFESLTPQSIEDVYDITVDDKHAFSANGIYLSNCSEQSLESYELCCLVETFPLNHNSLEDFKTTLKYAYLYAKTVTLIPTHWTETNEVMLRNRRIGCSQSGIAQFVNKNGIAELIKWSKEGYDIIEEYDIQYSSWFAVPVSIKRTSIKPSGSVSLLAGATPGVHYPESNFYIRRIRLGINSNLLPPIIEAGYKVESAFGSEKDTVVVEIPVSLEDKIPTLKDVTIWQQVQLATIMQKYWADNAVSFTGTFNPSTEGKDIKNILDMYQYELKAVSFLPQISGGAYPQMPYEEISKEKYQELIKNLKPVLFNNIEQEKADVEKFCSGDKCNII